MCLIRLSIERKLCIEYQKAENSRSDDRIIEPIGELARRTASLRESAGNFRQSSPVLLGGAAARQERSLHGQFPPRELALESAPFLRMDKCEIVGCSETQMMGSD
jgi:hypothetical protein